MTDYMQYIFNTPGYVYDFTSLTSISIGATKASGHGDILGAQAAIESNLIHWTSLLFPQKNSL